MAKGRHSRGRHRGLLGTVAPNCPHPGSATGAKPIYSSCRCRCDVSYLDFSWQWIPHLQNTVAPSRVFLSFDLAHCKDFFRDRNYIVWISRCFWIKLLVYYDGDYKESLYCILRDRRKNLILVLVSQNNIKNTGPRTSATHRKLR